MSGNKEIPHELVYIFKRLEGCSLHNHKEFTIGEILQYISFQLVAEPDNITLQRLAISNIDGVRGLQTPISFTLSRRKDLFWHDKKTGGYSLQPRAGEDLFPPGEFNLPLITEKASEQGRMQSRKEHKIWVKGHYERNPSLQADFRKRIFEAYGTECYVDNCNAFVHQLEAAHIQAVQHFGSFETENGRPLCANHHLSFDKGYLRFKDDKFFWGNSVLSDGDSEEVRKKYGEHELTEDDLWFP